MSRIIVRSETFQTTLVCLCNEVRSQLTVRRCGHDNGDGIGCNGKEGSFNGNRVNESIVNKMGNEINGVRAIKLTY